MQLGTPNVWVQILNVDANRLSLPKLSEASLVLIVSFLKHTILQAIPSKDSFTRLELVIVNCFIVAVDVTCNSVNKTSSQTPCFVLAAGFTSRAQWTLAFQWRCSESCGTSFPSFPTGYVCSKENACSLSTRPRHTRRKDIVQTHDGGNLGTPAPITTSCWSITSPSTLETSTCCDHFLNEILGQWLDMKVRIGAMGRGTTFLSANRLVARSVGVRQLWICHQSVFCVETKRLSTIPSCDAWFVYLESKHIPDLF